MRSPLKYSMKCIDKELERTRFRWERLLQGNYEGYNFQELIDQRLDQRIAKQQYDWIIDSLCDYHTHYSSTADYYLQINIDTHKAKENNYLAALASEMLYSLLEKGFSTMFVTAAPLMILREKNLITREMPFLPMSRNWCCG